MEMFDYEKKHLEMLREHLAECTVLLKTNGKFPLQKPGKIAAYGSGVRQTRKGGTGSGEVNSRFFITVEQGLKDAGFEVTSEQWLESYDELRQKAKAQFHKDLKAEAKAAHANVMMYSMGAVMPEPEYDLPLSYDSDVAIYVVGRICGEGSDRKPQKGDLLLTDSEIRDILALNNAYDKFMLVLNVGGPVDLTPVMEVENILLLSQLGVETGKTLADILLGEANPSGKLTTTWAGVNDYNPDIDFGNMDDTCYYEGIYVGYRYFDSVGKKPLFPFGYGLSYTSFEMEKASVTLEGEQVTVFVKVTNTGEVPGKEVVQVYVSTPAGELDKAYQDLAGFAKTEELQPMESQVVEVEFGLSQLASYSQERKAYFLDKGDYIIRVGNSSENTTVAGIIELDETVETKKVHSIIEKNDFQDKVYGGRCEDKAEFDGIPRIKFNTRSFETCQVNYDVEEEILPEVATLTEDELISLGVGAFDPKAPAISIVGNAAQSVCGAAGETSMLVKQKYGTLVMADGPAGLRLDQRFYRDEKGVHSIGAAGFPESVMEMMPKAVKLGMKLLNGNGEKLPEGAQVEYQYATAIPIGTGIAQSWNTDFARLCGDIVGDEMERFGIHLWLAPALNIHRSILCGRNFEYYSEDPLISGKFAAALTQGVQSHPGCGTTIKHFAANNQEKNRLNNNSKLSERALREIYLRGFEICVREASPCAIMSSYNLINGTHSSETRGLITDFLRAENGFDGMVMTDWVMDMAQAEKNPKHRGALADKVAEAGGDVFMPGGKKDFQRIKKALHNGELSHKQLEINGSHMLKMIMRLQRH